MKLHSFLCHISQQNHRLPKLHHLHTEASLSNEIRTILNSVTPMEPMLDPLLPFISPQIVTSILQNPPNPQLGFRFFIWTTRYARFDSFRPVIIDRIVKDKDSLDTYWQVILDIQKCGIKVPTGAFSVLLQAYSKAGLNEKAIEGFGMMKDFGCEPDVLIYNLALHAMLREKVASLALSVYNMMLKSNCLPNVFTFSILIDGLAKNGQTQYSIQMYDEMTTRGILPNKFTYTTVISALCQAERIDEALRLFNTMKESGCEPDFVTYNSLLGGFCKLGRVNEAFALWRCFEKDGYLVGADGYSVLIHGLFKAKRYGEAQELYQKLIDDGIQPDVVLYTIMMKGSLEAGEVEYALKLLDNMTERGVVPDTRCYNALIQGFCDLGLLRKARSLLLEISKKECFPNTCTYTILICGMCRNGLVGNAEQLFNEMEKLGCHPSVVTFNALIDGLFKAREFEKAHRLFCQLEVGRNPSLFIRLSEGASPVRDSASLQRMVEQYCESGLIHKAYKTLVQLNGGLGPDIVSCNILLNGFCKADKINGAVKLFKKMQKDGPSPDEVTYGTVINGLLIANRQEEALRVFDQMVNSGCTRAVGVYRLLMTWFCRRKKVSEAFSLWLKYLCNGGRQDEELKKLEESFKQGEVEKAVRGLLEMDFKFNGFYLQPYTICLIGLCQARRLEDALKIYFVLVEYKVSVTPPTCVRLIYSLCRERKLDLAVDIFLYTIEKGYILSRRVCNKLLVRLLRSEDTKDNAFGLLSEMKFLGYDLDAHLDHKTKRLIRDNDTVLEMENVKPG